MFDTEYQKKCSEGFTEYFCHSKNGIAKCVSDKDCFSMIDNQVCQKFRSDYCSDWKKK